MNVPRIQWAVLIGTLVSTGAVVNRAAEPPVAARELQGAASEAPTSGAG